VGGMHGALVTAVCPIAFKQGLETMRRKGAMALNSLLSGNFDLSIFDTVLNRITIWGSIVGTRKDLQEAIQFAVKRKVKAYVTAAKLEDVNDVFEKMKKGQIAERLVLEIAKQ